MKKSKTPEAADGAKWLEYYSPKAKLDRILQTVLKKHRRKLKANAKKPKQ